MPDTPLLLLTRHATDGDLGWQDRARCALTDPEAFFPDKGGSARQAKQVCQSCEVRAECLDYALENDERFGIWGGMSERERRQLKKQAPGIPVSPVPSPGPTPGAVPAAAQRPSRPDDEIDLDTAPAEATTPGGRADAHARTALPPAELALFETCRQRGIHPLDKAEAIEILLRDYTGAQIAQRTGLSPATVSYYQAILELDQQSREQIRAGRLSAADAVAAVRAIRRQSRARPGRFPGGELPAQDHEPLLRRDEQSAAILRSAS